MPHVIVSGYYGFGNLGDEAILQTLVQELGGEIELVALSADPAQTRRRYGIEAVGRTDLAAVLGAMEGASLFLSGGGGLMQDVTGYGSVPYYAGLMKLAQWRKIPTMVFAQGLGPLRHAASRWMVRSAFKKATMVTLRDETSVALARELGVAPERLEGTADPVLCLKPCAPARVDEILDDCGVQRDRPVIGVAIRPWYTWYELQFKALTSALNQLALRSGAQLLLLPFQLPGDERITQELFDVLSYRPAGHVGSLTQLHVALEPDEMAGLIGRMDMVLGMRLHALIMAAAAGVSAVGLAYDPKVRHLCEQWGFPCLENIEDLRDATAFERMLELAWDERHARHEALTRRAEQGQARARRNFELVRELVGLKRPQGAVEAPETGV